MCVLCPKQQDLPKMFLTTCMISLTWCQIKKPGMSVHGVLRQDWAERLRSACPSCLLEQLLDWHSHQTAPGFHLVVDLVLLKKGSCEQQTHMQCGSSGNGNEKCGTRSQSKAGSNPNQQSRCSHHNRNAHQAFNEHDLLLNPVLGITRDTWMRRNLWNWHKTTQGNRMPLHFRDDLQ